MFSTSSSVDLKIVGLEGLSPETLREEIDRGAKLVIYTYAISILVLSFKRPSSVYFIRPGQSRVAKGLPFTLVSLLFGWWGFPWGIIYTLQALSTNLGGGTDVTSDLAASLAPRPASAATPPPLEHAATAAAGDASGFRQPLPPPSTRSRQFRNLAIGVAVVALAYLGICFYQGHALRVALVSGLAQPYQIELNGTRHTVAPGSPVLLELSEGEFVLRGAPGSSGEQRFSVATPFLSRPFDRQVLVINPDRAALLYREAIHYYSDRNQPSAPPPPQVSYFASRLFHVLPAPDYFFIEPAKSISMPARSSGVEKSQLSAFSGLSLTTRVELIRSQFSYEVLREHLENEARLRPDDEVLHHLIAANLQPADGRRLFETRLAERPVRVEWHRAYEFFMSQKFPELDLVPSYRASMEASPDDSSLIYLYARLLRDPAASRPLFERALHAKQPSSYAAYALAYDAFGEADYSRSLDYLTQAEKLGLQTASLRLRKRDTLLALDRIPDVLTQHAAERTKAPDDTALFVAELMLTQAQTADRIAGQRAIAKFAAALRAKHKQEDDGTFENYLNSRLAYSLGEEVEAAALAEKVGAPIYQFEAAIARRDHEAGARFLDKQPEFPSVYRWMLVVAAHARGDSAAMNKHAEAALAQMEREGRVARESAAQIKAATPDSIAKLLRSPNFSDEARVLFTAVGLRLPEHRSRLFDRARELDRDPAFPHLLLISARHDARPQRKG